MKTLVFEGKIGKVATTIVLSKITKKAFDFKCSPIRFNKYEDQKLPKDTWIKVRNIQTGICGSDMTFYTCGQSASMAMYPIPCSDITYLGHESVGIVSEVVLKNSFLVTDEQEERSVFAMVPKYVDSQILMMIRGNLRVYVNDVPVKEPKSKERYVLV